jgi:hypothetical protein
MSLSKPLPNKKNALKAPSRNAQLKALKKETERELYDMIERLLDLPMHKRTHFLRRKLPGGGSAL